MPDAACAEVLAGARVTFNYFDVLGQSPLHGRGFLPQEDTPGNNHVAILSYGLWQRRFDGDLKILGQTIKLDNRPTLVVGIMPPGFDFPASSEIWTPLALPPAELTDDYRFNEHLTCVARLRPGVSIEQAGARIQTLAARRSQLEAWRRAGAGTGTT